MTKTAEQFVNPPEIVEDLVSRLKSFAIPGVDVNALMGTQRKNIEALATASRSAMDGAQSVGKRQGEILQESMNRTAHSLELLLKAGTPIDIASKQVELVKDEFEKALGTMRELAEMVTTAQRAAFTAVSDRMAQSLDELKGATKRSVQAAVDLAPASAATASTSR